MEEEFEIYGEFASVYDMFMDNIPYVQWHKYIKDLLINNNVSQGTLVELACGTGTMTKYLAEDGYDVIGTDISEDMLSVARDKCPDEVLLLHQDMRELTLAHEVDAVLCVCDGMNYLLTEEDIEKTARGVYSYLKDNGIFLFDMKTKTFYKEDLGNYTFTENRDEASLIWENEYHEDSGIHEYLLTIYQLVDEERDLFSRAEEYHRQRAYDNLKIQKILEKVGFTNIQLFGDFTFQAPEEECRRVYFLATK